jgi:Lrp/AsnC family transcriptional regulator, regulator for asnA, asnC and gidA
MESLTRNQNTGEIDDIDRSIIEVMRQDGRVAFAQIAQQLDVSPGMIRVRYNRLMEMGILKVVAITNPLRLGYTTMAMIGIRTDGDKMLEVAEKVSGLEEVIYLIVVSGRYDILCEVVCRDNADLLHFLSEKLYKVPGVRETESFMHLKIQKEVYF